MLSRTTHPVHVPALSLHEAAMLPALEVRQRPRSAADSAERTAMTEVRRSMAGRAVLTYIKSAPNRGPKR